MGGVHMSYAPGSGNNSDVLRPDGAGWVENVVGSPYPPGRFCVYSGLAGIDITLTTPSAAGASADAVKVGWDSTGDGTNDREPIIARVPGWIAYMRASGA